MERLGSKRERFLKRNSQEPEIGPTAFGSSDLFIFLNVPLVLHVHSLSSLFSLFSEDMSKDKSHSKSTHT